MIPEVFNVNWTRAQTILDVPALVLLSYNLPGELRGEWRPLYSNHQYGDSFSQLQTRILKQGPSVIVVRDKAGHVFGGFASAHWDIRPQFVGKYQFNCIFSLQHTEVTTTTFLVDEVVLEWTLVLPPDSHLFI